MYESFSTVYVVSKRKTDVQIQFPSFCFFVTTSLSGASRLIRATNCRGFQEKTDMDYALLTATLYNAFPSSVSTLSRPSLHAFTIFFHSETHFRCPWLRVLILIVSYFFVLRSTPEKRNSARVAPPLPLQRYHVPF